MMIAPDRKGKSIRHGSLPSRVSHQLERIGRYTIHGRIQLVDLHGGACVLEEKNQQGCLKQQVNLKRTLKMGKIQ